MDIVFTPLNQNIFCRRFTQMGADQEEKDQEEFFGREFRRKNANLFCSSASFAPPFAVQSFAGVFLISADPCKSVVDFFAADVRRWPQ
jgi:hypothetical protein